jgi:hypothetical protein
MRLRKVKIRKIDLPQSLFLNLKQKCERCSIMNRDTPDDTKRMVDFVFKSSESANRSGSLGD